MSTASPWPASGDRFTGLLTELATPEILRNNAFRVVGLPTDATGRDVQREGQRLAMLARLEDDQASSERADAALQRLRDPARRLVDEMLWLWPEDVDGAADHNAAIRALQDLVEKPDVVRGRDKRKRADHRAAVDAIAAAWCSPEANAYLARRVLDLDDPRLSVPDAGDLLAQAQVIVPALLLREASRLLRRDRSRQAGDLVRAVTESDADRDAVRTALDAVFGPTVQALRSDAKQLAERETPASGVEAIGLMDRTMAGEGAILLVLPADDPFRSVAVDDIARAVNTSTVRLYTDGGGEPGVCLRVLRRALALEPSAVATGLLEDNIRVLEADMRAAQQLGIPDVRNPATRPRVPVSNRCWFCKQRDATGDPLDIVMRRGASSPVTVPLLRCIDCEASQKQRSRRASGAGCVGFLVLYVASLAFAGWLLVEWWDDIGDASGFANAASFVLGVLFVFIVPPLLIMGPVMRFG